VTQVADENNCSRGVWDILLEEKRGQSPGALRGQPLCADR
jgi:hypothetical protein